MIVFKPYWKFLLLSNWIQVSEMKKLVVITMIMMI